MWIRNISRRRFFPFSSTGYQVSCDLFSVGRSEWSGFRLKDAVWSGSATTPQGAVFVHKLRDAKQFVNWHSSKRWIWCWNPPRIRIRSKVEWRFLMRSWSWLGMQSMHTFLKPSSNISVGHHLANSWVWKCHDKSEALLSQGSGVTKSGGVV